MNNQEPISNDKKTVRLPIVVAITLVAGIFLGATFFGGKPIADDVVKTSAKFKEILMYIDKSYVDKVNTDSLADYGIEKMLEKLDPHTSYLPPAEAQMAQSQLKSGFDGIGVEFNIFNDTLFVVTPLTGGPSEAVGIQSGDIILKANEVSLSGKDLNNTLVFNTLRGPRGSDVKLHIKRKGFKDVLIFNVKRDKIPTFSIDASYIMADKKTGYIKINRFSETTYDEFKQNLSQLKSQGMSQLLIDLRGNPGGYMQMATNIVDELVGGDDVIVYTKGKDKANNQSIFAGTEGIFEKGSIVVLVDEGSASAAEIVSGSLQDYDRATIVGRRTFGKGLVQAPITLSDGSELRLTISRYYIPSGRSIQKPYELGNMEGYMEEMYDREKKGELYVKDSIKNNQKLKFKTKGGRTVYGGGGITPDIFVAQDTSYYSKYLVELFSKNILREYALIYASDNKKALEKMTFNGYLNSFAVSEKMLADLNNMAVKSGAKFSEKDYKASKAFIISQMKALVAKNIWKESTKKGLNNEFYQVVNQEDEMIKVAMGEFKNPLKLSKN